MHQMRRDLERHNEGQHAVLAAGRPEAMPRDLAQHALGKRLVGMSDVRGDRNRGGAAMQPVSRRRLDLRTARLTSQIANPL